MNELHKDFLVTYDPSYFEEHSESSEFEESIPTISSKNNNQFLLTKAHNKVTKKQKELANRNIYRNHEYKCYKHAKFEKTVQTSTMLGRRNGTIELSVNNAYGSKQFNQITSNSKQEKSLIRHKVLPCLSSMFGLSSNKMFPTENYLKTAFKDNSRHIEGGNNKSQRRKKYDGQQKATVTPVHVLGGVIDKTIACSTTENTQTTPHDNRKSLRRVYSNIVCNVAVIENECEKLEKMKRRQYKKRLQSELKEMNLKLKYNTKWKCHCQQFPSKQSLYHIFASTNQCQYSAAKSLPQKVNSPLNSELSITSSGFWHYLLEKFNKKCKVPNSQQQRKDIALQSCPVNFDTSTYGPYIESRRNCLGPNHYEIVDDCPCSDNNINYPRKVCRDSAHNFDAPTFPDRRKKTESKDIQCECYPPTSGRVTAPKQNIPTAVQAQEKICGCQHPHDQMVDAIANKYNGEILCIHNPPCILINGCLNVTQPTDASPVNTWPIVEKKKDSIFRGHKKTKSSKQKQEKQSQYYAQCVEVRQCQTPEKKSEKIIQSICNHNPPCEVVRCCHKTKYDSKLQNSCIHVPMCPKIPECLMRKSGDNKTIGICEHKPKCLEVPLCTRKYVALTAKDSIGTQVKPQTKMFCRHNPPCMLIPKCLGGVVQETNISYEAIPNCVHQPLCDLIPACYRKSTKGMVSTYCQYPNGCRVV